MNDTAPPTKTRRKFKIAFGIFAGLVLVVLVALLAAGPIAAKLAEKELRDMGFAPQGLNTLTLDWWEREVRFGPISLEQPGQAPLRIESLTLHYDLGALWDRRIWVRRLDIGGIDVSVVRDENGALFLNDVALPSGSPDDEAPKPEDNAPPWLAGLDRLTLNASHILYKDAAAGVNADVHLDRVELDDFFGWQPDQSGRYTVRARINDMNLNVDGTAKPFAKPLALDSKGQLAGITLERLSSLAKLPEVVPLTAGGAVDWDLNLELNVSEDTPLSLRAKTDVNVTGIEANVSDGAATAKVGKLSFQGVSAALEGTNSPQVRIARIGGEGLELNLTEKIAEIAPSEPQDESSDTPTEATEESAPALSLRVEQIELDANSRIVFNDASFDPPFKVQLDFETLKVTNVSTDQPDEALALDLSAKINEFAPLSVSGWAKPLAEKMSFDLKGSVEALDLPPFSPYAAKAVGMHLDGGRVGVTGTGKVDAGNLDAKLDIGLDKLAFTPLSDEDREKLSASVGMPVETVIGLLEDGDGHIGIALPITGDMEKPEFDLSDAIGQAVGGAVKAAAGGIFKVLFPPAALISLISENADGTVDFNPVAFDAGTEALSADGKAHADQLALVLKERPKLGIRLCGRTTAADQDLVSAKAIDAALALKSQQVAPAPTNGQAPATQLELSAEERETLDKQVRAQLAEMAVNRARNTKRYLIEMQSIEAGRLAECRSLFDAKDTLSPRVEVAF